MIRMTARFLLLSGAVAASACASAVLSPLSYPEPDVACPAGRVSWRLEVVDQRADRTDSERVTDVIRESITRSFPGCRWEESDASSPLIRIEVHRFTSALQGNIWDAAVEWSVAAEGPRGESLTNFTAEGEVSRPNYRGSNNELEALKQAFDQSLRRTLAGLRTLSLGG
ncbi:MAG: hypothetical protein ABR576_13575 [Thermoanaerobaculia bacterium]